MTGSLLTAALMRAQSFLLEPVPAPGVDHAPAPPTIARLGGVAVVGMRSGSGCSTVAGGLAAAFTVPGRDAARVMTLDGGMTEHSGSGTGTVVWDVPPSELDDVALRAERIDATVLIAPADSEPALASVVADFLEARQGGRVLVAANRVRDPRSWVDHATICLPDSRLAALLAARGRVPPGELGLALTRLATLIADDSATESLA